MIVEGTHAIAAPRDRVFDALTDPAILARALPGCRELVRTGDDAYGLTIEAGAGSISGIYNGEIRIGARSRPTAYAASLAASGTAGSVEAALAAELSEAGEGTAITYRMDAKVAGPIAGVGQRVLAGVSRKNAGAFFAALEQELNDQASGEIREATGRVSDDEAPVYVGRARTAAADEAVRWFVKGAVTGSLLTAISIRLAGRRH